MGVCRKDRRNDARTRLYGTGEWRLAPDASCHGVSSCHNRRGSRPNMPMGSRPYPAPAMHQRILFPTITRCLSLLDAVCRCFYRCPSLLVAVCRSLPLFIIRINLGLERPGRLFDRAVTSTMFTSDIQRLLTVSRARTRSLPTYGFLPNSHGSVARTSSRRRTGPMCHDPGVRTGNAIQERQ